MRHASFDVEHLDISSALQLTLWPARAELGALTAAAFSAFGTDEQGIDLHTLGHDFVSYLQFESVRLESADYSQLWGFQITHSVLSSCMESARKITKRTARILSARRNGPSVRGFGDSDDRHEITAVFSQLSATGWRGLIAKLGRNPNDLSQANAPGVVLSISRSEYDLLGPPYSA